MTSPLQTAGRAIARVLVVHCRYQQRGGEDAVVDDEAALLRSHGLEVRLYERDNHDLGALPRAAAATQTLWSHRTTDEVGRLLDDFRPDVVHVHNTFPLISPSIYWAASRRRVPVIQTLHNFRLLCPQGMLLREGRPCEDCVGKAPWRGVVRACYRDSRLQSATLATMLVAHRSIGTWQRRVARYIALNEFCRDRFIAGGLPPERVVVKPNSIDLPPPPQATRAGFLFAGRLSPEKGVRVLAAAAADPRLRERILVIGSGPEADALEGIAAVVRLGAQPPERVYDAMRGAVALVLPSIWYENHPRTLVEAFASGLPVIASRIGALATLVDHGHTGLLFEAGAPEALAEALVWAQDHPDAMAEMGRNARRYYELELTDEINFQRLMTIYQEAVATRDEPK